jgi:outer membrane protein assembly factor BamD
MPALMADLMWTRDSGWQPTSDIAVKFSKESKEALTLMNDARLAQEDGRMSTAIAKYKTVCKNFQNSIFAPEAYYQTGKIKIGKSQFNDAFKAFSMITRKYPEYSRFNDVLHEEFEVARLVKSGERPKYFGVIPGFRDYRTAIGFYKKIVEDAPFSDIAPLALSHIGELAMNEDKYPDAIAAFEQLIDEYPYSEYTPGAYFHLGNIHARIVKSPLYDQGSVKMAIDYYEDFLAMFPEHELVDDVKEACETMRTRLATSKLLIGDFYFNARNNPKAAIIMYRNAAKMLPDSEIAQRAHDRIDYIRAGNLPKKRPVDFLFGRYRRPPDELLEITEPTVDGDGDKFEFQTDLIRVESGDGAERKRFTTPIDDRPSDGGLEIGPKKTF